MNMRRRVSREIVHCRPHYKEGQDHAPVQYVLVLGCPPLDQPHDSVAHAQRIGDVQDSPLRPLHQSNASFHYPMHQ
jgi:hypothetical protein